MAIRQKNLSPSDAYLFVATWNGSNSSAATGLKADPKGELRQVVISQIGIVAASLFEGDFLNYNDGYILCQNIPDNLNIAFTSQNLIVKNNFQRTLRFTVVKMPSTFKSQKGNLSTNYEYGERLRVSVSVESINGNDAANGRQVPTINGTAVALRQGPIPGKANAGVNFLVYRDANMAGRTLKSQSGGGGGVGVWS
jgi:hypothetical protein